MAQSCLGKKRCSLKKSFEADLYPGGDHSAKVFPFGGNGVKSDRGAEIDDHGRASVRLISGVRIDQTVDTDLFGVTVFIDDGDLQVFTDQKCFYTQSPRQRLPQGPSEARHDAGDDNGVDPLEIKA